MRRCAGLQPHGQTTVLTAAANGIAGALLNSVSPRWIWGGAAIAYAVAAVVGYALARDPVRGQATVEPAR